MTITDQALPWVIFAASLTGTAIGALLAIAVARWRERREMRQLQTEAWWPDYVKACSARLSTPQSDEQAPGVGRDRPDGSDGSQGYWGCA